MVNAIAALFVAKASEIIRTRMYSPALAVDSSVGQRKGRPVIDASWRADDHRVVGAGGGVKVKSKMSRDDCVVFTEGGVALT